MDIKRVVFVFVFSYSIFISIAYFRYQKQGDYLVKRWDVITCCYSTGDGKQNTYTAIVAQSCLFDSQKPFRSEGYDCFMVRIFGADKVESVVFRKGRDKVLGKLTVIPVWWKDYKEAKYFQ